MYELLRQQLTDLIKRFCSAVFEPLTSCNHYQVNVRFLLVVPDKQYHNCERYEHSTTESFASKLPLFIPYCEKYYLPLLTQPVISLNITGDYIVFIMYNRFVIH